LSRVSLVQANSIAKDKEKNLAFMEKVVNKTNSDLIVFGELFLTGYLCHDSFSRLAEYASGPSVQRISKLSQRNNCYVVFGMPEKSANVRGIVYNTAVLTHPDGKVDYYRKWVLPNFGPFEEKRHFQSGSELPVFSTKIGKVGLLICYDIFFPEISKTYALKGGEILCCISASPTIARDYFEKVMMARAIENTAFFIYTNLVGVQGNLTFWGGNAVISPRGELLAKGKYFKEQIVDCDIDIKDIKPARNMRPVLRDTRHEMYDILLDALKSQKKEGDEI
jgi:predicted amidohydrolase